MQQKKFWYVLALAGIMVLAGVMRFWNLAELPPGLYSDESAYANDALETAETGNVQVFYADNFGREGLFINSVAIIFRLFGHGIAQLRFVAASAGMLVVIGVYVLTRMTASRSASLWGAFFIAVSFWPVAFSRIGYRGTLVPAILVWTMIAFLLALRTRSWKWFILAGALLGLGFHTYISFRAVVPAIGAVLVYELWVFRRERHAQRGWFIQWIRAHIMRWVVLGATAGAIIAPLVFYMARHPHALTERAFPISIFFHGNPTVEFFTSAVKTLGMFHVAGDPIWRHNIAGAPMLIFPVGLFFLAGLFVVARTYNRTHDERRLRVLLFTWLLFLLLPSMMTSDHPPHALRAIGALPAVFIFSGIGAQWCYRWVREHLSARHARVLPYAAVLLCFMIGGLEFYRYFIFWPAHPDTRCQFIQYHVDLAKELAAIPVTQRAFIITDVPGKQVDEHPIAAQSLLFLLHGRQNILFVTPDQFAPISVSSNDRIISLAAIERQHPCKAN